MSRPVSLVLPSLDRLELLQTNLPPLVAEVERRAVGDEIVVVDDTGRDVLAAALEGRFPSVRVLARGENGGFARALRSGVEAAQHEVVFSLNTDVRVRPGFLEPLVGCLEHDDVAFAVPCVLLNGQEGRVESLVELHWERGLPQVVQPALGEEPREAPGAAVGVAFAVAFAVGGTALFRREDFLARGGFDPLYEPFYWEDVDLGLSAWRDGRRVVYQPASVVEHHHRGTIGRLVREEVYRAAIEKNRLLLAWKHLESPELLRRNLATLLGLAVDAWIRDEREPLIWLNLALEQRVEALAARRR